MTLDNLLVELRSRGDKLVYHIEQLPSAENPLDENYSKILNILQKTIQQLFDLLDDLSSSQFVKDFPCDKTSDFVRFLLHDIRAPLSNFIASAEFISTKYDGQLSTEQIKSVQAIEHMSNDIINYLKTLDPPSSTT